MKILITGSNGKIGSVIKSQIGKVIKSNFEKCDVLNRDISFDTLSTFYDLIIHCAANTRNHSIYENDVIKYMDDNVFLTKKLLDIKSSRFVFLSTTALYPKRFDVKDENSKIDINDIEDIYGITKFISECLIRQYHQDHLILRCVHVLHNYLNLPKSIVSMKEHHKTTLSSDTYYNFILVDDILNVLNEYMKSKVSNETVNVASDDVCSIKDVESIVGKVAYGNYTIDMRNVKTTKLKNLFPTVKINSSINNLKPLLKYE
jgi:nucleoside-diphosphate-sugar epimerase